MGKRLLTSFITGILLAWACSCSQAFLVFFPSAYILFGGWPIVWRIKQTLRRDLQLAGFYSKLRKAEQLNKKNNVTYHMKWQKTVDKQPNKVAIRFQDEEWTYIRIVSLANKIANYLSSNSNLDVGDTVALVAENCPEYIVVLLALSKLGCPAALINFNLSGKQLLHTIEISSSKVVIVTSTLSHNVKQIEGDLNTDIVYYSLNRKECDSIYKDIIQLCHDSPVTSPTGRDSKITPLSTLCYIYTSGTTGLPKACIITHAKAVTIGVVFNIISEAVESDIFYVTLPLYHTSGLIIATGTVVNAGCSMYLKSKFSASEFWDDCVMHNCTVIIYIGELCRYLLLQPSRPSDTNHRVTRAIGNGLRTGIWQDFRDRFLITRILEVYGSTEGFSGLMNLVSEPGYIGYLPISLKDVPLLRALYNLTFVARIDPETGDIVRGADGLCIRCEVNESGEALGMVRVGEKKMVMYLSQEATKKTMVRNVVTHGDLYCRTGDIMSANELGFLTFLDRRGDTFRWKGENVSTSEVESIFAAIIDHDDVIVYSVAIPGIEGRAGMAAIVKKHLDLDNLLDSLKRDLPSYSVPLFIRLIAAPKLTATYKYSKIGLKREGFDINTITDPVFFLDPRCKKYVPLDNEVFSLLMERKLRL
ncbi:Long-chain fatty acid transport protein 4-like [Oopsacas minuta]|uniref:Long-chain-fatty-acid--CoA ligase n=1 Tax=Oopsacas minuta TaxID=111878 RepID=A0AAV7KIU3_9METZ|nr:Long-chain fatty acid transport protein 4-like [Oopsacas minuta]